MASTWRYEPVTFPLEWDAEGNVIEAFSPDFYLVQQDLYVELTTLRPKLMRFKNHKIRRIKELYPEVNIKLWRRKDFVLFAGEVRHASSRERPGGQIGHGGQDAQAQ